MTLAEANILFEGWDENPPINFMLKAIIEGFGGKSSRRPIAATDNYDVHRTLAEISSQAGPALPVIRGKDHGLPSNVILDIDEMRKKNMEKIAERAKRRIKANG